MRGGSGHAQHEPSGTGDGPHLGRIARYRPVGDTSPAGSRACRLTAEATASPPTGSRGRRAPVPTPSPELAATPGRGRHATARQITGRNDAKLVVFWALSTPASNKASGSSHQQLTRNSGTTCCNTDVRGHGQMDSHFAFSAGRARRTRGRGITSRLPAVGLDLQSALAPHLPVGWTDLAFHRNGCRCSPIRRNGMCCRSDRPVSAGRFRLLVGAAGFAGGCGSHTANGRCPGWWGRQRCTG